MVIFALSLREQIAKTLATAVACGEEPAAVEGRKETYFSLRIDFGSPSLPSMLGTQKIKLEQPKQPHRKQTPMCDHLFHGSDIFLQDILLLQIVT